MGSWAELDAIYPPGTLTPAAAFLAALARLAGAASVYAPGGAQLAAFAPRQGLAYDHDVLARAERFVRELPEDAFLEAAALLNRQQRLCLALNLQERVRARSFAADPAFAARALAALGLAEADLARGDAPAIRADLSIFPQ